MAQQSAGLFPRFTAPDMDLMRASPQSFAKIAGARSAILDWLAYALLSPSPQHVSVSLVQLAFLVGIAVLALIRILFLKQRRSSKGIGELPHQSLHVGSLYVATISLILLVCLCHTVFAVWRIGIAIVLGWDGVAAHEVLFSISQALTWMAFAGIVAHEKRFKSAKHSPILRTWWIINFLLAALLLATSIAQFVRGRFHDSQLWFDSIVNVVTFPVAAFLLVVATVGSTGITLQDKKDPKEEPLLPKYSHEEKGSNAITGFYTANFFGKATFTWMSPLLRRGVQKPLVAEDIPQLSPDDKADRVYEKLMENYNRQEEPRSLKWALLQSFWPQLAFTAFLAFVKVCVVYVGPLLITRFVDYVGGEQHFPQEGLVLVAILFMAKCIEVLCSHHFNFFSNKLGMVMRSALITTIYRKGLVLSSLGRQSHGTGPIVNYMSVDVQQVADSMLQIHNLWAVPLHALVALGVLLSVVGVSCFAGLAVMLIILSVSFSLARVQRNCQGKIMFFKDKRMALTTEVLNGMKIIKMQAWEDAFQAKIKDVRNSERYWLSKFIYCLAVNIFILWLVPVSVSTVTFTVCILLGQELTSGRVFTTISTFRILQEPMRLFPQALMGVSQALNSLDRLQQFMWSEELEPGAVDRFPSEANLAVEVERGFFTWDRESERPTLRNIEAKVPRGSLVCIVGQVGSGKSTLLAALLGEVPKVTGTVRVSGTTAYVAQSSWIQNATIEENIRFGKPMDRVKYQETLRVCAMIPDLAQMPFGDQTEIGERGINLSGGQKQRIQLARAVYQDADVYFLDDVFSAVDAHTGSTLFQECIRGALSRKTVLLVTHQVDFLHGSDQIWVMRDGEIVQCGKYDELLDAGLDFGDIVDAHNEAMDHVEINEEMMAESEQVLLDVQELSSSPVTFLRQKSLERQLTPQGKPESGRLLRKSSSSLQQKSAKNLQLPPPTSKLIEEEERETGQVGWRVYFLYFTKTFKGFHVLAILFFQSCWQGLQIGSDYYLSYATSVGLENLGYTAFLRVYTSLAFGSSIFTLLRALLVAYAGLKIAQSFFLTFLSSIMRAPMAFFDTTPTGRILSRLATDQSNVDIMIPLFMGITLALIFQSVGVLIVVIQVTWYMIFIIIPLAWVYLRYQRYYLATSRELTRIDNITKAPIIHHFSETVSGFFTIRAFREQERFKLESLNRVNSNLRMDFHNNASNEWLGFRLELIGTIVLCTSALFMVTIGRTRMASNLVGLSLSYGLALNSCLYALVFVSCQLENKMVSVERIKQYSNIPSEAPPVIENRRPPQDWPLKGSIQFQKLQLRYRPDAPLVLKGISLSIRGGEKIGVVGRTGSGKSTLILALFRLVEPAGGHIHIDELDISEIGLKDLRSRFGIIPQDPTLFEGTVRSNIDPLGLHSDAEIWRSLEKCQLADIVREKEGQLDSPVLDSGENWSMGQRQLFCLGRALLNRNKILMLDEATASVDAQTDAVMQRTIRQEFADATVISIAHRIATVMDSDKVLVLDSGHVREFDSPARLLDDPSTIFSALVREYTSTSREYQNNQELDGA